MIYLTLRRLFRVFLRSMMLGLLVGNLVTIPRRKGLLVLLPKGPGPISVCDVCLGGVRLLSP